MNDSSSTPYSLAKQFSSEIEEQKYRLAEAFMEEQHVRNPSLETRWGKRGREQAREGAVGNLGYLAEAVALGDKTVFIRYILWLVKVLEGAGVPAAVISEHLKLMVVIMPAILSPGCSALAASFVAAALGAMQDREAAK